VGILHTIAAATAVTGVSSSMLASIVIKQECDSDVVQCVPAATSTLASPKVPTVVDSDIFHRQ
jgi:hypothetical protein